MIIFCTFLFVLLIFPIYIHLDGYFNSDVKKVFVNVSLYKSIKVLGGYFDFYNQGIAFHISDKKAILFPIMGLFEIKEKIKPLMDYHIKKINIRLDVGNNNQLINTSYLSCLYVCHNDLIGGLLSKVKPYLDYKNDLNIIEENSQIKIYLEITTVLNLLMILISLVKISLEKLYYAINK